MVHILRRFQKLFGIPEPEFSRFLMPAAMIPRERESFETPCYMVGPDVPLDFISSATCYKESMNQIVDYLGVVVTDAFGLFRPSLPMPYSDRSMKLGDHISNWLLLKKMRLGNSQLCPSAAAGQKEMVTMQM